MAMTSKSVQIDTLIPEDWPDVRRIYQEGINTGDATFETQIPSWERWDAEHLPTPRLVARQGGGVVGWAALSPVSPRPAYAGVAEVSVYVTASSQRQGVGKSLLRGLVAASEAVGVWTLQAGIFPENEASIALHLACGFRQVGIRQRLSQLQGLWRDVVLLERRSPLVGTE
jgi:phosphinothricin acetyltransferase